MGDGAGTRSGGAAPSLDFMRDARHSYQMLDYEAISAGRGHVPGRGYAASIRSGRYAHFSSACFGFRSSRRCADTRRMPLPPRRRPGLARRWRADIGAFVIGMTPRSR